MNINQLLQESASDIVSILKDDEFKQLDLFFNENKNKYLNFLKTRYKKRTGKDLTEDKLKKIIKHDLKTLKLELSNVPKSVKNLTDEKRKKAIEFLEELKKEYKIEDGSAKRQSNEKAIKEFLKDYQKDKNESIKMKLDFKDTKIKEKIISFLKRDAKLKFPKLPAFLFEAKKGKVTDLNTNKGILFAEVEKRKYSNWDKEQIENNKEEVEEHNKKVDKLFSRKILQEIKSELNGTTKFNTKPYLLIGGMDPAKDIFVILQNDYYFDVVVVPYNGVKRVQILAKSNKEIKKDSLITLKEFVDRIMVENVEYKLQDFLYDTIK